MRPNPMAQKHAFCNFFFRVHSIGPFNLLQQAAQAVRFDSAHYSVCKSGRWLMHPRPSLAIWPQYQATRFSLLVSQQADDTDAARRQNAAAPAKGGGAVTCSGASRD